MTHPHATRTIIARADLVDGAYYEGRCRNATVARWNAERGVFIHWRTKFSNVFLEAIKHPEDEHHFDVFVPVRRMSDDEIDVVKPIPFEDVQHVRGIRP